MEKKLLLLFILLSVFLSGCGSDKAAVPSVPNSQDSFTVSSQSPLNDRIYDFDSYEELATFLKSESSRVASADMDITQNQNSLSTMAVRVAEKGLPIPCMNKQPLELTARNGQPLVTIFSSELYDWPWIWYRCRSDLYGYMTVCVALLDDETAAAAQNSSCADFIQEIAPDAPNVDNFQNFEFYSRIYETEITTAGGTVSALVAESAEYSETYIHFVHDGMYVLLRGSFETEIENGFQNFSLIWANIGG